jgi:hypothetical protein
MPLYVGAKAILRLPRARPKRVCPAYKERTRKKTVGGARAPLGKVDEKDARRAARVDEHKYLITRGKGRHADAVRLRFARGEKGMR